MPKNLKEKSQKRDYFIPPTRVTEDEFMRWQENVRKSGVSASAYRRAALVDNGVVACRESDDITSAKALKREAIYQLSAVGRNLNQSATVMNIMKRDFQGMPGFDAARLNTALEHNADASRQVEAAALDLMS